MNESAKAWLSSAKMDLENIRLIIDNKFLTPISCFHSQQCIEKSMKALLESKNVHVPKTHDLLKLYALIIEHLKIEIDLILLQKINDLYIDSRYPGNLGLLPNGKPEVAEAKEFYEFAVRINHILTDEIKQLS